MLGLLLIVVLGLLLAQLNREVPPPTTDLVPDDVWAAFEASMTGQETLHLPRPAGTSLTTVGGMGIGSSGFVSSREAAVDVEGRMWLASTAVVHPVQTPGRVAVRRDAAGYHLQRYAGPVGLWDGGLSQISARVQVQSRFD
jgi:hypothetical protein